MSEGNDVAGAPPAPVGPTANDMAALNRRAGRMALLALVAVAWSLWGYAHFGLMPTTVAIGIILGIIAFVWGTYLFIVGEDSARAWLVPYVDTITTPRVLLALAAPLVVLVLLFSTIEFRDLPDGTSITVPARIGGAQRTVTAIKDQPLRIHFWARFRPIVVTSSRHAPTPTTAWRIFRQPLHAARMNSLSGVVVRLPLPALRYGPDGRFVLDGASYPTRRGEGALLIGDYPLDAYRFDPKELPFSRTVPYESPGPAVDAWKLALKAPVPAKQPFDVAYLVGDIEVAAARQVSIREAKFDDVLMEWTYPP